MFQIDLSNHYCTKLNPEPFLQRLNSSIINLHYRNNKIFEVMVKTLMNNLSVKISQESLTILKAELEYCCLNIPYFETKFMICEQITTFVRSQNYFANIGRGSSAASLICYGLGITNLNPTTYKLDWMRFLGSKSISIDIDVPSAVRDDLFSFLDSKYPQTFYKVGSAKKFMMKTAAHDVLKELGWSFSKISAVIDEIDKQCLVLELDHSEKIDPDNFVSVYNCSNLLKAIFEQKLNIVEKIKEKMVSTENFNIHPTALLFTENSLDETQYIKLKNNIVAKPSQMENPDNIVVNVLGLSVLNDLNDILKQKNMNIEVMKYLNFKDERVFATFNEIKNKKIEPKYFQTKFLEDFLQITEFSQIEDVAVMIAVNRPGVKFHYNQKNSSLSRFSDIVSETNGHVVFQEQLLAILNKIGIENPNLILKNLLKKKELSKNELLTKMSEDEYNSLIGYAESAYNKSHATAYSLYSYLDVFFNRIL